MSAEMAVWLRNCLCLYSYLQDSEIEMSSDVFWKSPLWRHLNAVPQVNCSTRLVHWQQNSCHHRLSVCAEQTAGTHWLISDVNGRSSTCSTQTDILFIVLLSVCFPRKANEDRPQVLSFSVSFNSMLIGQWVGDQKIKWITWQAFMWLIDWSPEMASTVVHTCRWFTFSWRVIN